MAEEEHSSRSSSILIESSVQILPQNDEPEPLSGDEPHTQDQDQDEFESVQSCPDKKEKLRRKAETMLEAVPRLEQKCATLPIYTFDKAKNKIDLRKYYICRVTIVGSNIGDTQSKLMKNTFSGTGLSRRMAKMAACMRALGHFDSREDNPEHSSEIALGGDDPEY